MDAKTLIKEVIDFHEGNGKYDFSKLHPELAANEANDAWQSIYKELKSFI